MDCGPDRSALYAHHRETETRQERERERAKRGEGAKREGEAGAAAEAVVRVIVDELGDPLVGIQHVLPVIDAAEDDGFTTVVVQFPAPADPDVNHGTVDRTYRVYNEDQAHAFVRERIEE